MPITFEIENIVTDLQNAIRSWLTDDTWFSGIDVFTPDDMSAEGTNKTPSDIEQRINQSLGSLKGVCMIVVLPVFGSVASDSPGIFSDNVPVMVRIIENPLINRGANGTQKTASMIATRVMRRLQHFTYRECVVVIKTAKRIPDENSLIWDVSAQTSLNLPALEITQTP